MGKQIFFSSGFPYPAFKTDLKVYFGIHRHKTNQNHAKHIKGLLLQQKNLQNIQYRYLEYMHPQCTDNLHLRTTKIFLQLLF